MSLCSCEHDLENVIRLDRDCKMHGIFSLLGPQKKPYRPPALQSTYGIKAAVAKMLVGYVG